MKNIKCKTGNEAGTRGKKWKRRLFPLIALGISFIIAFMGAEIILRFVMKTPRLPLPAGSLRNDPHTGTAYVPNFNGYLNVAAKVTQFKTNSQGLRDVERDYPKPEGAYRILLIGDSYVQGHGVEYEEMFPTVFERNLKAPAGYERCEVIKAGVGGWGPVNELNYLIHEGYKYDPDMVIVAFFTGNDYKDAEEPGWFVAYRGIRIERPVMENMNAFVELRIFLRKNCYLYGIAVDFLKGLKSEERDRDREDIWLLEYCMEDKPVPPVGASVTAFAEFQRWCREHNKELIVMILPHRIQLEKERAKEICKKYEIEFDTVDLDRLSRVLGDALSEMNIRVMDMTSDLSDYAEKEGAVSFPNDSHYNEKTQEYIGNLMAEKIIP
ncbi:SGNH/GDSL hydrolase family protein [Candidatus Sumerlaeota bacterium]|nr:SGNH/GDSL hydrolase family protein [Candidatus Sumerlaeota bacterium]